MKRELVFDGERAAKRFELLVAAMSAVNPEGQPRPPATIRKEARIQDALDALSDPAPTAQDPDHRVLKVCTNGNLRLTLSQEDFELLQSYSEKVPWNPRISRQVVDLWDWLSAAERRDTP